MGDMADMVNDESPWDGMGDQSAQRLAAVLDAARAVVEARTYEGQIDDLCTFCDRDHMAGDQAPGTCELCDLRAALAAYDAKGEEQ